MGVVQKPDSEDGVGMIALERNRQLAMYGPTRDSRYKNDELAKVAARLLLIDTDEASPDLPGEDWGIEAKHPDRVERLIIAGALVAAEIDRQLGYS